MLKGLNFLMSRDLKCASVTTMVGNFACLGRTSKSYGHKTAE